MRRVAVLVIVSLLASMLSATMPSSAASSVRFTKIYFNSPGTDTGSNSSLNAEYVDIKNFSTTSKTLTGWTVRDLANHVYKFGTFTLKPNCTVRLHTGRGTNTSCSYGMAHRYWGQSSYIWNNNGDKAILKNSSGTMVDTCSYSGSGSYTSC